MQRIRQCLLFFLHKAPRGHCNSQASSDTLFPTVASPVSALSVPPPAQSKFGVCVIFHGCHILVGVIQESVQTKDQLLRGRAGRFIQTRTTSVGGKSLFSPHPGLALAVQWVHGASLHNPMASLGQPDLWVSVGPRGGMETVWSAWLFAARLPSPSQGMFWGKDSFRCCGSHRKGGDTAEEPHPAAADCTSLGAAGDFPPGEGNVLLH